MVENHKWLNTVFYYVEEDSDEFSTKVLPKNQTFGG